MIYDELSMNIRIHVVKLYITNVKEGKFIYMRQRANEGLEEFRRVYNVSIGRI